MTSPRKHLAPLITGMLMAVILSGTWRPVVAACLPYSGPPAVLIVNENELARKLIFDLVVDRVAIRPERIHQTGDSAQALEMIRRGTTYKLAIIDEYLRPIPAPQLLTAIRAAPGTSALPVLVIVPPANGDPLKIADAVRAAGATDLVFKPFMAEELRRKIAQLICP